MAIAAMRTRCLRSQIRWNLTGDKPDWGQTKSYLIEMMVESLGSWVLAGKCEFALTAVPIANSCAAPFWKHI
jgi:hypothetical protein